MQDFHQNIQSLSGEGSVHFAISHRVNFLKVSNKNFIWSFIKKYNLLEKLKFEIGT